MLINRKVVKNGYSRMITIPKDVCDQMGIDEDTKMCIDCINGKIVMAPIKQK